MSQALTGARPSAINPGLAAYGDALRAEWIKVRTGSGAAWLMAGLVVLTVAISAAADAATRCPAGLSCPVDTTKLSLTGVQFGEAIVAILAVLPICNEYSTGMIRVTLAAMPRRSTVLAAKAAIVGSLVLVGRRPSQCWDRCWQGGSSCRATGSTPRAASRPSHLLTARHCAPPPVRCCTSA